MHSLSTRKMKFMKNRKFLLITVPLLLAIIFCGNNPYTLFKLNTKPNKSLNISPLDSGSMQDRIDQYKEVGSLYQEEGDSQQIGSNQYREEKNKPISIPKEPSSIQKISSVSGVMSYTTHGPINISSNADFGRLGYNFTGDGTYGDPYLIKGYQITNNSHILIHIENTTKYFKIDTNLLNGITNSYDAIFLKNVTHGIIFNNTIYNSWRAIYLEESFNNTIEKNILAANVNGVRLGYSYNNTISINTIYNSSYSGIYVLNSNNNVIINNTVYSNTWDGIALFESNNSIITLNEVYDNGFDGIWLQYSLDNHITDNHAYHNFLNGIKILNSSYNTLFNNSAYNNSNSGIELDSSNNNGLYSNTAYSNSYAGIKLILSSNYNELYNNTVQDNDEWGFDLYKSSHNIITKNDMYNNNWAGIVISSSSTNDTVKTNLIHNNGYYGIFINFYSGPAPTNHKILSNHIYSNIWYGVIMNTATHNFISNNTIEDNSHGIFMVNNADNNTVFNNTIGNNNWDGIHLNNSNFNSIDENDIYCNGNNSGCSPLGISEISFSIQQVRGGNGIFLDPSNHNNITGNRIYNNSDSGIWMEDSSHNLIEDNDIYGNGGNGGSPLGISDLSFSIQQVRGGNGIFLDPSNNNSIIRNTINNNAGDGIALINSSHNLIEDNDIYGNGGCNGGSPLGISDLSFSIQQARGGNGIFLDPSDNNHIAHNLIHDNCLHGVLLINSDEATIYGNTMYSNGLYGIYIDSSSINNEVESNDFVGNNIEGTSQAFDEGVENLFRFNYWDEWTGPDEEDDGIVDEWYIIDGEIGNTDRYALTLPKNPKTLLIHFISRPRIVYPNGGETISGPITIECVKSIDFWDHTVVFSFYYSSDNGRIWILLESELENYHYDWDTNSVKDGSNYLIKVVAICSEGLEVEDMSDATFTIQNGYPEPTTSEPVTSELTSKTTESKPPRVTSGPGLMLLFSSILSIVIIKRVKNLKTR